MDSSEKIMYFIEIRQAPECNLASLLDGERHVFLQLCEGKELFKFPSFVGAEEVAVFPDWVRSHGQKT